MDISKALNIVLDECLYPYQLAWLESDHRFRWTCASRQVGKSHGISFRRIVRGIARKRNQFFLSAGERQSRELMMKARQHCEMLKMAFEYSEHDEAFADNKYQRLEIQLPEVGIRIVGLPANPNTARGFTGDVFLDEFALHQHDREVWAAMFPSIMRGGGEIDVASTPRGKSNMFYDLGENDAFEHTTITIHDAIANGLTGVDPQELRRGIGDEMLWRQEFLCEFIDGATAFLTLDMIRSCEDENLRYDLDLDDLKNLKGDVFVGVDIGRKHDLTVIWAFQRVAGQLISVGLIELRSTTFREQFDILCQVIACPCVRRCCIDATGLGMQLAEEVAQRFGEFTVEGVTFTAQSKEKMAGMLRVRMEDVSTRIPMSRALRDDLHSIEKSVTLDGHIRLQATRTEGSHADRFWAVALAVYAASEDAGPVEAMFGPDLHTAGEGAW